MSIINKNNAAFTLIAQKLNFLNDKGGDLSLLTTSEKSTLVAAINELDGLIKGKPVIDDTVASDCLLYTSDAADE